MDIWIPRPIKTIPLKTEFNWWRAPYTMKSAVRRENKKLQPEITPFHRTEDRLLSTSTIVVRVAIIVIWILVVLNKLQSIYNSTLLSQLLLYYIFYLVQRTPKTIEPIYTCNSELPEQNSVENKKMLLRNVLSKTASDSIGIKKSAFDKMIYEHDVNSRTCY